MFLWARRENATCETIKTLINDGKEISMSNGINLTSKSIYENLFEKLVSDIKNC